MSNLIPILGLEGNPPYMVCFGCDCTLCLEEGETDCDAGMFVYFDAGGFVEFFECEVDTEHDHSILGRWGTDKTSYGQDKGEIIDLAKGQIGERLKKMH